RDSARAPCRPPTQARRSGFSQLIERTYYTLAAAVEHVRVDHRCRYVGVAEQLLHGADVVTRLQQVRGERVTQNVRRDLLGDAGTPRRFTHGALYRFRIYMMTPFFATARIDRAHRRRKYVLPAPAFAGIAILHRQGVR